MQTSVTARHFELTPELKALCERELESLTRYFDPIISAEIILDQERHRRIAEMIVKVYNNTITASAETDDMVLSIDAVADKVKTQLKKYKAKLKNKKPEEIEELTEATTRPETDVDTIE
ncbi:MAG: ribosome-associated translation inhibitor RaiA [Candidatus Zixiibacteriota bacterium]|nr:MAG: ribosome-associated translation inhibitor RaiA [candidate division Zixibacteria bacterium]